MAVTLLAGMKCALKPGDRMRQTNGALKFESLTRRTRWRKLTRPGPLRNALIAICILAVGIAVSGCHTVRFYGQAIKGQCEIFAREQPIEKLLAATDTPTSLKNRLDLLRGLRDFAGRELKLPIDDHYRRYADLHRPYVVWNVEAAPEFSLEPKTWWYPFVGRLSYRGYFLVRSATNYSAYLQKKGYDVSVGGVTTYSTLGWFKDPALNTFLFEPEAELAETLFHELGHQRVFANGDTDFDEAFATTVGQEGARRWLKAKGDTGALDSYVAHIHRTAEFSRLVKRARERLETLYGDERTEEGKVKATKKNRDVPPAELRRQKQQILEEMKQEYAQLKARWGGISEHDGWFDHLVNNAQLNAVATYYDSVPGFERLLASNGDDLEKFYQAVERLSKQPRKTRHEALQALAGNGTPGQTAGTE
jgi:predicted aminopeptidase